MYETFYKLNAKPFRLSPDARFFYNSSPHRRAMAYLRYGLQQGEGFIVITGGIGTGKTMLVQNLFAELDSQNVVAAQLVSTQVSEDDILRLVNGAFGLAHEHLSKAALLHNLGAFLAARQAEGKRVLLVVDEAQNLPRRSIEELRMLSNYQGDGKALLQSFLLGQNELRQTLQGPGMEQVRQRIIAAQHLEALSRDETQQYMEHRLLQVGWQGDPEITEAAYDSIHQASRGIPRRVNTLADRLLLFGGLEELHQLDDSHVAQVTKEMSQELGWHVEDEKTAVIHDDATASDMEARVSRLEAQLDGLTREVKKGHRLLRKMIELQMEMDGDRDDG